MKGLGITISPKFVYIAFGKRLKDSVELIDIEQIRIPSILATPNKLHYIRTLILDSILIHQINNIGIRVAERQAPNTSLDRIEIEGILQELTAEANLQKIDIATLREFADELEIKEFLSDYLSGKKDFVEIKHWYICNNSDAREAAIACAAALK
ncbi:MAG: hypothetical protein KAI79_08855 [Bacteroidales bacterium]|nr:hypothetical protein [Bacteroidales bacterium]